MQNVQIIGRLGRDPEVKYTQGGTAIGNFSVAVGEKWKDRTTGQQQERTEWFQVEAWGRLAEIVGEYLHKGAQVYIRGKMVTHSWDDQTTGEKKYRTQLRADEIEFLQTNRSEQGSGSSGGGGKLPSQTAAPPAQQEEDFDDDIPF
jgi:single-strand DNA-binding protein